MIVVGLTLFDTRDLLALREELFHFLKECLILGRALFKRTLVEIAQWFNAPRDIQWRLHKCHIESKWNALIMWKI